MFEELKAAVADIMPKIYQHPFNQELAQGNLALEKFIFYLKQDALYLADFSKALALTATRLPHDQQSELFMQFAMNALKAERDLHNNILKKYAATPPTIHKQSHFCFMYTNYLLRMASTAPVEEAVASLLPCFWVYQQVGQRAYNKKIPNNPYQAWIDLYSSHEFNHSVDRMIATLNDLAIHASIPCQQKMLSAFRQATLCEWQFWQGAYIQQTWPI
ncbi:TenA family protein [Rickettsiella endosymbiont of Miltochrista miniata]|uniref:TenA family protein n=1 Tax=Rickettsiella endosymbiont of Miltochrista miniata TaxID=3066239 RepID=UPI00313AC589